jgi:two-component sensor histidine kinase
MDEQAANILLIEDDPTHAELLRRAFAAEDPQVRVIVTENLTDAKACLAEQPIDLIITAWLLPDGRGTGLLPGHGKDPSLPVVLMSSRGSEQTAVEAIKAGALDYVVKSPVNLASMPHVARRALREWGHIVERRRAEEELRTYREHLEELVAERTFTLAGVNEALREEIEERVRVESQLRVALQEKEVLLQEVHHRVKNNLQLVSSLLDMQSLSIRNPTAEAVLQDSRNRVKTMALVHERLYQSHDLASVDVGQYIKGIVRHLDGIYAGQAPGVKIDVQVESVGLNLDTAIPCGLIINELVSNALKYAFPRGHDRFSGHGEERAIRIGLCRKAGGQLLLFVGDNGVGLPPNVDLNSPRSLGMRLVAMLTQQLGGSIALDRRLGTSFQISFPGAV